jgi:hypothetical protein
MNFGSPSPASIWAAAIRTLTGLGVGAFVPQAQVNGTIAAAATLSLAPAANRAFQLSIGAHADASGTVTINLIDGTNTWTAVTIAAGTSGGQDNINASNGVFWTVHNNSATVAAAVWYAGILWIQ